LRQNFFIFSIFSGVVIRLSKGMKDVILFTFSLEFDKVLNPHVNRGIQTGIDHGACCYSELAYGDVQKLKPSKIRTVKDGSSLLHSVSKAHNSAIEESI
jgi:hypothetical protein